jgi:FAD/FMN-containing dehydrogenase
MDPPITGTDRVLHGWGRHPAERCRVYRPERRHELVSLVRSRPAGGLVARGMGRSYGDAALHAAGAVVLTERLDRFLAFDAETGILECEGGAALGDVVGTFLPRGWLPPVLPGTRHVSVGGAVAADVHGKNHPAAGSFGGHVAGLELLCGDGEVRRCSPAEHPGAFRATVGGMGLAGIVLAARIRLERVPSAYVRVETGRTAELAATLDDWEHAPAGHPFDVLWLDCLASGRGRGRGVRTRARHALPDEAPAPAAPHRTPPAGPAPRVPLAPPAGLVRRWNVRAYNALRFARAGREPGRVVPIERFLFPLDGVAGWNLLYGPRGMLQLQAAFPAASARAGVAAALDRCARAGLPPLLAVLKRMGGEGIGHLSFALAGWTLALDFACTPDAVALARELGRLAADHGGRVYLAKDAVAGPAEVARMYPALPEFREAVAALDPHGVFRSSLGERLGLAARAPVPAGAA